MAVIENYLDLVLDQLSLFGEIETKRMFGGVGLFHKGLMFGKIGGDTFRLRVDEHNQKEYEDRGMKPFYSKNKMPSEIFEDKEALKRWAVNSYEAAERTKK